MGENGRPEQERQMQDCVYMFILLSILMIHF